MTSIHRKGLILVAVSSLLYSTPGLFTRGVSAGGWEVIFWRGVFGVLFASLYLMWRGSWKKEILGLGKMGWLASCIWASGAIAYLHAFKLTSIANVSLIYGIAPILTALVAWLWFKERPRKIVLAASALAFFGVVIITGGSIGSVNIRGDLLALWMTMTVAISFPLYRKHPEVPTGGTTIMAAALSLPFCLIWGNPFSVPLHEIFIMAIFGLVFVTAAIMLTDGSKLLPAGETALLSNLEIPLQPVLAWLIFSELPPQATFIGGLLILVSIAASTWPFQRKT